MQDEKNSVNERKTSVIIDVDLNVAGQVKKKTGLLYFEVFFTLNVLL